MSTATSQLGEQRVVATKPKIGARPAVPAPPEPAQPEPKKKGRAKLLVVVLALLAVAGGAAYWFLLRPSGAEAEAVEPPPPEPGHVLEVEAISLNLADGHYLRIGLGLQLTADVEEDPDTARALDHVVSLFSGRPVAEVASAEGREALKAELLHRLTEAYEGEVMDVYFTDYVTQ